jgi:hypothetical protein
MDTESRECVGSQWVTDLDAELSHPDNRAVSLAFLRALEGDGAEGEQVGEVVWVGERMADGRASRGSA